MTNKTVRPIMTVEARDAIDNMHKEMKADTRSESIVLFSVGRDDAITARDYHYNEASKWKLIAWSMTAACFALAATIMIAGV